MPTVAILPVKRFDHAKHRLRGELSAEAVRGLAQSMFSEVLLALSRAATIEHVIVVTAEPVAEQIAGEQGATALRDDERGHNAAAALGVRHAIGEGAERVLLVPGDCPLLRPTELDQLIARELATPSVLIIPDRHGTGTNALLLSPPDALAPSFGPDSCARHQQIARATDVHFEVVQVPSLALDVDTPEDLAALARAR